MAVMDQRIFDDGSNEAYQSDLYDFEGLAHAVPSLEQVGPEQIQFFATHGYLAVDRLLDPEQVSTAIDALMALLEGDNPGFKGVSYEKASAEIDISTLPAERKQDYVRKFMSFVEYSPVLKELTALAPLRQTLQRMMGEPPVLTQDMALLKPPRIGREKPWHQDHAYFNYEITARVVGVWIALDEASTDNGCMIIVPGSHRKGPVVHFRRRDWQICDKDARQDPAVAVPLPPGGALFFSSLLHHGTPTNVSDQRRRALQFHYCPASAAKVGFEERLKIFGSEGKDVTC